MKINLNCLTFNIDGQGICDPTEITNRFCQYFTSIGPNLAKGPGITSTVTFSHMDSRKFPAQSIFFNSATEDEIIDIASTKSSKPGKAAGYDKISMSTIKQSIHYVAAPLIHIVTYPLLMVSFQTK